MAHVSYVLGQCDGRDGKFSSSQLPSRSEHSILLLPFLILKSESTQTNVGALVGAAVGALVGADVGALVGADVGALV